MARRVAALLLALSTAVVLLAAPAPVGAAPPDATGVGAPKQVPAAGRPAVGDCHALTPRENQALIEPDRPTPCSRRHTTVTYKVPTVRLAVVRNLDANYFKAYRACRPGLARAVRGTERTLVFSAFNLTIFGPTRRQVAAGARWVRCDVYLPVGTKGLRNLPTNGPLVLGRRLPLPDRVARCGILTPRGLYRTVCAGRHTHRAAGVVPLRGKRYPGDETIQRIAQRRCPALAGPRWYSTSPGSGTWSAEPRKWLVCHRPTARQRAASRARRRRRGRRARGPTRAWRSRRRRWR